MNRLSILCLALIQLGSLAANNKQAELLCVWNYKTLYTTTSSVNDAIQEAFTKVENFFFFSDQSYVRADLNTPYEEVLKMKNKQPKRWLTADNHLILFDESGKQEMGITTFGNQPVENLLKGEKEININVALKSGTAPQPYNDILAFSPQ